ncbi:HD domain-containing protein [Nonomuraea spiralis]|uniref:HD domain-containing protein n=1 Tax=Nonomuraea spiralis TaxID=46182 RepID=A0ABV5J182_9ACTN|nr:HD domain-containing protein [Nonomuraea spiralis]GGS87170.1 hypothetical protein GCM10010176_033550 [Nonomuraea spiralis]
MTGPPTPPPWLRAGLTARFTSGERDRIRRAHEFAARRHAGQVRKSGDPYITHPVAVAEIALDAGLDCDVVCAALLHDVIEDTGCEAGLIRAEFGDEVTALVEGMTALERGPEQAVLDVADDRVLALKVFDRLHNMRTLQPLDQARRELKSRQTLAVVAPVAARLGLRAVAAELESIARRNLPGDTACRVLALGSLLLPRAHRDTHLDEWLGELDVLRDRRARARFAFGLVRALPALSLTLRRPPSGATPAPLPIAQLRATGRRVLCWILRSELRTWTPLTLLLAWVVLAAARNSPADAVVTLITVPPVLHAGVRSLRARLGPPP